MAGSRSTAPFNRSNSVLIAAPSSPSDPMLRRIPAPRTKAIGPHNAPASCHRFCAAFRIPDAMPTSRYSLNHYLDAADVSTRLASDRSLRLTSVQYASNRNIDEYEHRHDPYGIDGGRR
jgi:hypothetical protein